MKMSSTPEKIVEVTRQLFASQGVENTSVRQIASAAGVNIAAINYHFGGRDNLVKTIFEMFIRALDEKRDALLAEAKKNAGKNAIGVRAVVVAHLRPWIDFKQEHPELMPIFRDFVNKKYQPDLSYKTIVQQKTEEVYGQFLSLVGESLPGIPETILKKRIHIAISMALSMLLIQWLPERLSEISGLPMTNDTFIDDIVALIEGNLT